MMSPDTPSELLVAYTMPASFLGGVIAALAVAHIAHRRFIDLEYRAHRVIRRLAELALASRRAIPSEVQRVCDSWELGDPLPAKHRPVAAEETLELRALARSAAAITSGRGRGRR